MSNNNRENIYKRLLKEYSRKANATQKPKVKELLNLYQTGEVFSKVTMQRQLNRYLGKHVDETARDIYFYKTMAENMNNTNAKMKVSKKLETTLKKAEHITRYRESSKFVKITKIDDEVVNKKPLKLYNMQLNTKMAYPAKIFKLMKAEDQDILAKYEDIDRVLQPHKDVLYQHIEPKIERVFTYRLIDILKQNKSIKVSVGLKFDTFLIKNIIDETENIDKYVYKEENLIAKTKATAINKGNVEDKIKELLIELDIKINERLDKLSGSGWRIKQYHTLFIEVYKIKDARGSSYIPTPAKYSNSFCGLVNIRNEDNECFKWCMRYHQSEKKKHDDRVTVLSKLEDKYKYDNISFPVSYDDVKKFEINNECCIFIYYVNDNG